MEIALIYRWAVFILLVLGLILLMKHGVLTPFVFWSRIQYYTFSTFTLFFIWLGATLFKADIPFLYTADCRYIVAAGLVTLSVMYHIIVRPGAIRTHRLNDISYEQFSFYNYIFHYFIPVLMTADYLYPYTFMDPRMNDVFSIAKGCLKVGFQFFLIGICVYAAGKGLYLLDIPPAAWTYNG